MDRKTHCFVLYMMDTNASVLNSPKFTPRFDEISIALSPKISSGLSTSDSRTNMTRLKQI